MTQKLAWPEIEPRLRQLRLLADDLKVRFPDEADFFPRFADLADEIREAANDECLADTNDRITEILLDLRFVPREPLPLAG